MLEMLFDNRSGMRNEIVVLVFNESVRVANLLDYYGGRFDLVFLDGGSTDGTLELLARAKASAYRRRGPEWVGENHFVHYVNHETASGRCFYLFADELAERDELERLMNSLAGEDAAIYARRLDWYYGARSAKQLAPTLRGVTKGRARYDPSNLHNSLQTAGPVSIRREIVVHHFHVWSMAKYFGQAGAYAYTETTQHLKAKAPVLRFLKRFMVSEVLMLPRHLWRLRAGTLPLYMWRFFMSLAVAALGALCWIELKYLKSPKEQLDFYRKMYESGEQA